MTLRQLTLALAVGWLMAGCAGHEMDGDATQGRTNAVGNRIAEMGEMCGGFAAIQCGDAGAYCQSEPGACVRIKDYAGVCKATPEACTLQFAPVCGCDGQTYDNDCKAASAGVSVAHAGACQAI